MVELTEEQQKIREDWKQFYNRLDPMGKQFFDLLVELDNVRNDLTRFMLERGQLYGFIIFLMEKYNLDSFSINWDEMKKERNYMLVFTPDKDNTVINVERKLWKAEQEA